MFSRVPFTVPRFESSRRQTGDSVVLVLAERAETHTGSFVDVHGEERDVEHSGRRVVADEEVSPIARQVLEASNRGSVSARPGASSASSAANVVALPSGIHATRLSDRSSLMPGR